MTQITFKMVVITSSVVNIFFVSAWIFCNVAVITSSVVKITLVLV